MKKPNTRRIASPMFGLLNVLHHGSGATSNSKEPVSPLQLNKTLKVETRMSRSLSRWGVHVQSGKTTQPPFSWDLRCPRAVNELRLKNSHKNSSATQ